MSHLCSEPRVRPDPIDEYVARHRADEGATPSTEMFRREDQPAAAHPATPPAASATTDAPKGRTAP